MNEMKKLFWGGQGMKGIAQQENELTWGGGKALNLDLEETIPEPPSGFSVGLPPTASVHTM